MTDHNPYAAPSATISEPASSWTGEGPEPAGRGRRYWALMIDTLYVLPITLPIIYYVIMPQLIGVSGWAAMGKLPHLGVATALGVGLFQCILTLAILMLINGRMLSRSGQTIGKRLLKIRIVNSNGGQASMATILKRYSFQYVLGVIPKAGGFISMLDGLLIFSEDRRCLHDRVAGTMVIKANPQG